MDLVVQIGGRAFRVRIDSSGTTVDGRPIDVDLVPGGVGPMRMANLNGRSVRFLPERAGPGAWTIEVGGARRSVEVFDPGEAALRAVRASEKDAAGPAVLRAPMPGLVVKVEVAPGDRVEAGQGIVIVEAMKMENELAAPAAGQVRAVLVAEGEPVEKDDILIEFEPREEA